MLVSDGIFKIFSKTVKINCIIKKLFSYNLDLNYSLQIELV